MTLEELREACAKAVEALKSKNTGNAVLIGHDKAISDAVAAIRAIPLPAPVDETASPLGRAWVPESRFREVEEKLAMATAALALREYYTSLEVRAKQESDVLKALRPTNSIRLVALSLREDE